MSCSSAISIHAPPRGATSSPPRTQTAFTSVFQFTPLREGRQIALPPKKEGVNFNSRPSARGDARRDRTPHRRQISIHAPPRGATSADGILTVQHQFQFTPLREGRRQKNARQVSDTYFNSRPSARGDNDAGRARTALLYFNSRPSARGDPAPRQGKRHAPYFNSRPSARGDHAAGGSGSHSGNFNSRPSARGDTIRCSPWQCPAISIHAPPRGATLRTPSIPAAKGLFQFTPLREGRQRVRSVLYYNHKISIHAPPRGATRFPPASPSCKVFQFTPLREGRRLSELNCLPTRSISIHAPPRGATTVS